MLRDVKACVVFSLVVGVVLDRRDMPERGMQPLVIIPVDPSGCGAFHITPVRPRPCLEINELRLVQPDRLLHQTVVVGVADGADRPVHLVDGQQPVEICGGVL